MIKLKVIMEPQLKDTLQTMVEFNVIEELQIIVIIYVMDESLAIIMATLS